jgi:LysR family cyn operon transcriptional activator
MTESIEIRHLRYFLAVAQTENFTRAAERLRISQPSISQQIGQLERILGVALFRRVGKRVFLTEAGIAFRGRAEVVLRKLEDACASVEDIGAVVNGRIDIGVIPALHVTWVPPMLAALAKTHPGLAVGVHEMSSSQAETEIEAGRLDLGFGLIRHDSPHIHYQKLHGEPFSVVVADDSELAQQKTIPLARIDGLRMVMLSHDFDMRQIADTVTNAAGVYPRVIYEVDSIDSMLACVRRTGMPTLLPRLVLRGRPDQGLRAIPIRERTAAMHFGILWPASHEPNPATVAVANALKQSI